MEAMQTPRQLAGIKHVLYHPRLPTLRRMDMDTVLHKLTSTHSRHTTRCPPESFELVRSTVITTSENLHCEKMAETDTVQKLLNYQPVTNSNVSSVHTENWNQVLKTLKAANNTASNQAGGIHGLAMRRKHPEITSAWKHALIAKGSGPGLSRPTSAYRPMPASMYSRYRNTSRPYSAYPWY